MHRYMRIAVAALVVATLAACSPPKPPEEERRPEPQAQAAAQPPSAVVQTADAYKDRARNAAAEQVEAADRQRAQIDAATQ